MTYKQELVRETALALTSYGFDVYLSKTGEHGFYTDGVRIVSFGSPWNSSLDFCGNYHPSRLSGTGWQITKDHGVPTKEEADRWIKENSPGWCKNPTSIYTTPEQHLKTYGASSGYTKFSPEGD